MAESYERRIERKYCYFVRDYVEVTIVRHGWPLIDGTWQEEEVTIECPRARKCRRAEHNCVAIHPDTGADPFVPFKDLLSEMW